MKSRLLNRGRISYQWFKFFTPCSEYPQFPTHPFSLKQGSHHFSTQNLSVQHQKPLSSTPKIPQFNKKIPHFHIKNPSVQHTLSLYRAYIDLFWQFFRLNWGVCGTGGFSVRTEGFLVWNRGILGAEKEWPFWVELRGCGTKENPQAHFYF